jgi:prevent-host-death family protein
MVSVGLKELRDHASALVRRVREEGEIIEITYHGEAVARIVPVRPVSPTDVEVDAMFTRLDALTAEIRARRLEGVSTEKVINDIRRDL